MLFKYFKKSKIKIFYFKYLKNKPVFLLAGNSKYFEPLKNAISNIKTYFPDFQIVVYELSGFSDSMRIEVSKILRKY